MMIRVNGSEERLLFSDPVSHRQICALAASIQNRATSGEKTTTFAYLETTPVTYMGKTREGVRVEGSLTSGQEVQPEYGMVFNVATTVKTPKTPIFGVAERKVEIFQPPPSAEDRLVNTLTKIMSLPTYLINTLAERSFAEQEAFASEFLPTTQVTGLKNKPRNIWKKVTVVDSPLITSGEFVEFMQREYNIPVPAFDTMVEREDFIRRAMARAECEKTEQREVKGSFIPLIHGNDIFIGGIPVEKILTDPKQRARWDAEACKIIAKEDAAFLAKCEASMVETLAALTDPIK